MAKREKLFSVTIKDCEIQTFTVGGPGGGGKDTSNTGVRITHRPSGAVGEGREERSQAQNKQAAFGRMARSPKFQTWAKLVASELLTGESVEQATERMMAPEYIKTEVKVDGKWQCVPKLQEQGDEVV
jgi:protein subunit release factor A